MGGTRAGGRHPIQDLPRALLPCCPVKTHGTGQRHPGGRASPAPERVAARLGLPEDQNVRNACLLLAEPSGL